MSPFLISDFVYLCLLLYKTSFRRLHEAAQGPTSPHTTRHFTLRSCCLPGLPPEVRFIGFSDPRELSGVLLSSYNTWPWRSVVWGRPPSQFLRHSSLLPTRCKSHMLPHHTWTTLHLSQPKNLSIIWGVGEVALTLYIISKLPPRPQVLTPLSEIQMPGRKRYFLYLLSHRFLELSQPRA